jgi:hypothetical protein
LSSSILPEGSGDGNNKKVVHREERVKHQIEGRQVRGGNQQLPMKIKASLVCTFHCR